MSHGADEPRLRQGRLGRGLPVLSQSGLARGGSGTKHHRGRGIHPGGRRFAITARVVLQISHVIKSRCPRLPPVTRAPPTPSLGYGSWLWPACNGRANASKRHFTHQGSIGDLVYPPEKAVRASHLPPEPGSLPCWRDLSTPIQPKLKFVGLFIREIRYAYSPPASRGAARRGGTRSMQPPRELGGALEPCHLGIPTKFLRNRFPMVY